MKTVGFLKDFIKYIPSKAIPFILAFAFVPILTRLISPEEYGIFTLILTFNLIMITLVTGWLCPSAIRFYAEYNMAQRENVYFSSFFFCLIFQVAIVSILYFFIIYMYGDNSNINVTILLLGMASFISMAINEGTVNLFRPSREIKSYSFYLIVTHFLQFTLSIGVLLIFDNGIKGLFSGYCLGYGIVVPFMMFQIMRGREIAFGNVSKKTISSFASYGIPLVASNVFWWILNFSDRYLINLFMGKSYTGIYAANYDLIDKSIRNIGVFFIFVASPIIMHAWATKGQKETQQLLKNVLKYLLLCMLPIVAFVSIDYRLIARILLNENYYSGIVILPIVSFAAMAFSLQQFFQYPYLLKKNTRSILLFTAISAALNLGLNVIFIPEWGIKGAAVATLISSFLLWGMMATYSRKYLTGIVLVNPVIISIMAVCCSTLSVKMLDNVMDLNSWNIYLQLFMHLFVFATLYCAIIYLCLFRKTLKSIPEII